MPHLLTFLFLFSILNTPSQAQPTRITTTTSLSDTARPSYSWPATMESCLRLIRTGPDDQIKGLVYEIASTWMAAGFMGQANQLLTTFWSYKTMVSKDYPFMNEGFQIMWAVSRQQPASLPFKFGQVNDIVQQNWMDVLQPAWRDITDIKEECKDQPWANTKDSLLVAKAMRMSYDAHNPTLRASREQRLQAVKTLSHYLANRTPAGYDWFHSSTCATLIAASVGEDYAAKVFLRYCGKGYLQDLRGYTLLKLMSDTATARLLLSGTLAPVWGLTKASCDADLVRVLDVLGQRITKGPSLVYGQLPKKYFDRRIPQGSWQPSETIPRCRFKR